MQISVDVSTDEIINTIKGMSLDDIERVKTALIERELYFVKYKPDEIVSVISDFREAGYSDGFLKDLEDGLKKSSIHNED